MNRIADRGLIIEPRTPKQARRKIAQQIKEARLNSGLNQWDVAKELNISQSTYSRMEQAKIAPDCAQIRTLSGLYNMSILSLMGMPNYFVYVDQSSSSSSS
jgi:transcriptional regulator with XRE-family HTH domain